MTSAGMPRPDSPGAAAEVDGQATADRLAAAQAALRAAEVQSGLRADGSVRRRAQAPRHARDDPGARDTSGSPESRVASGPMDGCAPPGADGQPDPRSVAHTIALRALTVRPHSRAELERKLARRGCAPQVAHEVLDRLTEAGLVDDAAFAETLVQSRQRTTGRAGAALLRELRDKGVDADTSRAAVGAIDEESERARAQELATRKLRTLGGLAPDVQARRLAAMLSRRGYPVGIVYAVVRDVVNAAPEHQRD